MRLDRGAHAGAPGADDEDVVLGFHSLETLSETRFAATRIAPHVAARGRAGGQRARLAFWSSIVHPPLATTENW
jgi:hypothetical protein